MPLSLYPHCSHFLQELSLLSCRQELNSDWYEASGQDINRKRHLDDATGLQAPDVPVISELRIRLPSKPAGQDSQGTNAILSSCLLNLFRESCGVLLQKQNMLTRENHAWVFLSHRFFRKQGFEVGVKGPVIQQHPVLSQCLHGHAEKAFPSSGRLESARSILQMSKQRQYQVRQLVQTTVSLWKIQERTQ